mmetsp:Transcript_7244/g.32123  ORF Transcript_7244/g.32123 Transcript_7244/m.32123 type:complete len:83 (+) Transcript_7244:657-905(+)
MALRLTAASRASFFTSLSVVMTPLVEAAVRKEMPKPRHIYGSLISFLGIYFISREVRQPRPSTLSVASCWTNPKSGVGLDQQ